MLLSAVLLAGCGGVGDDEDGEPSDQRDAAETTGEAEQLLVSAAGLDLEGDLQLPADGEAAATVVIVPGSGPQSRDGNAPGQLGLTLPRPVPVYRELAEALVTRGYGAVTWDKRTCGTFNGCAENSYPSPEGDLEFDDFADDVTAVVSKLAERDDLGPLFLLGHSQGGTVAAGVAAKDDNLAGLVLLSTPEPSIDEVLDAQADTLTDLVAAADQSGEEVDAQLSQIRELADDVSRVADGELDGPDIGGSPREFWAGWVDASQSAPEQVAGLDMPVLVLGGENDWNVLPKQVTAWQEHLGDDDELVMLPDITHALTYLGTDDVAALTAEDLGNEVDSSVPEAIASWLEEAVT